MRRSVAFPIYYAARVQAGPLAAQPEARRGNRGLARRQHQYSAFRRSAEAGAGEVRRIARGSAARSWKLRSPQQSRTENLAALGLDSVALPIPGFHFPTFVGPFSTFDARATATQSVFDFGSIRRYQASKACVSAAKSDIRNTDEQVAAQVARVYLAAVKADTDLETAKANVTLSAGASDAGGQPKGGRHGHRH